MPTPRALAIQGRLHQLVEDAHAILDSGHELDLAGLERIFTIRANDTLVSLLTAHLVTRVHTDAPGVILRFVPEGDEDLAPLREGLIDIDLGVIADLGPEVRTQLLYDDYLVGLVAAGHPLGSGRVTLQRLAASNHVSVSGGVGSAVHSMTSSPSTAYSAGSQPSCQPSPQPLTSS